MSSPPRIPQPAPTWGRSVDELEAEAALLRAPGRRVRTVLAVSLEPAVLAYVRDRAPDAGALDDLINAALLAYRREYP